MNEQVQDLLLGIADDELVIGWRDSEWTGIAPVLEEDVAFSSIAQNEIGHARAIYQLLADDADALAFDREPAEYRSSQLVELRFVPDWARTIARRVLYEAADELRLESLKASSDAAVAGVAAKIDREEAYHRMHAELWRNRLRDEPRYREALDELWPYAVAMTDPADRERLSAQFERKVPSNSLLQAIPRGSHTDGWPELWEEMTEVRRSIPGAAW
ncbi:MAG: 1,2-phenylacetyl-CoA epoxidase subunit PaaC [Verrucomicrobiota bacterium]